MRDLELNDNNELVIRNGDFSVAESEMQEVALILQSSQGEWKQTPILGPNLYRYLKGKTDKVGLEREMQIHLAIDNKDFKTLKTKIETKLKNG